jgi:ABC-type transporter Mla subunit MlaD
MNAEWWALGAALLAQIVAMVWGASRLSGTVDRLDKTLDKVANSLEAESRVNAVQDERLDAHDRILEQHGNTINSLWRQR